MKRWLVPVLFVLSSCNALTTSDSLTVLGSASQASASVSSIFNVTPVFDVTPVGSPTTLVVSAYAFYAGLNEDCSDATLVAGDGVTASDFDLLASPTLFTADLTAGTYNCLIMVISDNLTFRADAAAAAAFEQCTEGVDHVFDIYRSDSGEETPWIDINGDPVTATGTSASPGDDQVAIFATTNPTAVMTALGANLNQTGTLTGGLTVPGTTTFYVDATDGILGDDDRCAVEEVTMGFR